MERNPAVIARTTQSSLESSFHAVPYMKVGFIALL